MNKARFIVIESSDAAGGSTQTDLLVKHLKQAGFQPHQFHFPQADEPTGQVMYHKFLRAKNKGKFSRREQALLYIQDFFSKSKEFHRILALSKKNIIVSDRYCTSTMVYQSAGLTGQARQRMLKWIAWLAWEDTPTLPKPNMVIFLDIPVNVALERLKSRQTDFHERRVMLERFRCSYLRLAQEQQWVTVNGVDTQGIVRSREDIHQEIWQHVRKLVGL